MMSTEAKIETSGFRVTDEEGNGISVRKVYTAKGKRIEIAADRLGTRNRLDAIALESTTWQEPSTFREMGDPSRRSKSSDRATIHETAGELRVSNEFAEVVVKKLPSGGVKIASGKMPYSIELDAEELETLTYQDPDLFSEFLETPFGPE